MILRFSLQPDSLYSQIFRKSGQKKVEPNRPIKPGAATDGRRNVQAIKAEM
jgi:hypothetical protein